MLALHFQTTVLSGGRILLVLPESLCGKTVKLNVSTESAHLLANEELKKRNFRPQRYLKGYLMEKFEEAKYEHFKDKYLHD